MFQRFKKMNYIQRVFNSLFSIKNLTPEEAENSRAYLRPLYSYFGGSLITQSKQNLTQIIRQGYQSNVDVYSVVNYIAELGAKIPLVVQEFNGDEWSAVKKNHPLQTLINKPNPYQSGEEFRLQMYSFYLTTGNGLAYSPRIEAGVNSGQATEMWIMPSDKTSIVSGGWMNPIKGYKLTLSASKEEEMNFDDVLHMRTASLSYGNGQEFWGQSPLTAGLLALERSNANYNAAVNTFKNQGLKGILMQKEQEFSNQWDSEQQSTAQEQFDQNYNNIRKFGGTMMTNQQYEHLNLGLSPVDMSLILDKQATLRDFCNIYKVSSILFNDNAASSYNNILEVKKSAYNDAILPIVGRYVEELNTWLAPSYGENIRVIYDTSDIAVLQLDRKTTSEWITRMVNDGVITRNEAREYLAMSPSELPEMDMPTVPFSTSPITATSDFGTIPAETEEAAKWMGEHYMAKK